MLITHSVAARRLIADAQASRAFEDDADVVAEVAPFGSAQLTVITYASPDMGRKRSTRATCALDASRARNAASVGSALPGRKRTMTRASGLAAFDAGLDAALAAPLDVAAHPSATAIVISHAATPTARCGPGWFCGEEMTGSEVGTMSFGWL